MFDLANPPKLAPKPKSIWMLKDIDPADLAVAVAGDFSENIINPMDYLYFWHDLDTMNIARWALRLGYKLEDIRDISKHEMVKLVDKELMKMFPQYKGDDYKVRYELMGFLFYPFSIFKMHESFLIIEHRTILPSDYKTEEELKQELKRRIGFDIYDRYRYSKGFTWVRILPYLNEDGTYGFVPSEPIL